MRPLVAFLRWASGHRLAWGVIAAVLWTMIVYLLVRNILIALLCGAAFGAVSATSLPSPPPPGA
ncbi:hypothetical protein [Nonomuraea sp. NPDC002799]